MKTRIHNQFQTIEHIIMQVGTHRVCIPTLTLIYKIWIMYINWFRFE